VHNEPGIHWRAGIRAIGDVNRMSVTADIVVFFKECYLMLSAKEVGGHDTRNAAPDDGYF